MINCKNCGKELPDTARFCSACGATQVVEAAKSEISIEAEPTKVQCAGCGRLMAAGAKFCDICGIPMSQPAYGADGQTASPPDNNSMPANDYITPADSYSTPLNSYNTQASSYNPQANNYNTQANSYNTQANSYNTQANNYNTQANNYNTQANNYNPQANNYNPQANNYNPQAYNYGTPVNYYGKPAKKRSGLKAFAVLVVLALILFGVYKLNILQDFNRVVDKGISYASRFTGGNSDIIPADVVNAEVLPSTPEDVDKAGPAAKNVDIAKLESDIGKIEAAFKTKDVNTVTNMVHPESRERFRQIFTKNSGKLDKVAALMATRVPIMQDEFYAEYAVTDKGKKYTMIFQKVDDQWMLVSF